MSEANVLCIESQHATASVPMRRTSNNEYGKMVRR